jgi:LysM repeat protein
VSDWEDEYVPRYADEPTRRSRFSIWTLVAPIALLAAVSVIVVIARGAGWVGQTTETATTADTVSGTATTSRSHTTTGGKTGGGNQTRIYYTIRSGDTLEAIAVRYGTTIAKLEALNPGVDPQGLHIGQRLRLR